MDCLSSSPEDRKRQAGGTEVQSALSEIYTRLYTIFLKSVTYGDVAFENNATELTLGTTLNEPHGSGIFREDEILVYGMPERRQLPHAATKRLREEIDATLQAFAENFYASSTEEAPPIARLPDDLQGQVGDIDSMQLELQTLSLQLTELLGKTRTTREEFDRELENLICNTFPAFNASKSASIDLLSATFEATLQRLHAIQERARQAFYNHKVEGNTETVSQAISMAYRALVEEEDALKTETRDLDRQIQEYESLLRLLDGSSDGYQQIVDDWVRIKQETDECLKDLRRLGWTGD